MFRKLALFILMAALVWTPVLGSSENNVDRILAVKEDAVFEPGGAYVSLNIQELHVDEFGDEPVNFKLTISNAEWTEDISAMESDTSMIDGATIDILKVGDHQLEISLMRPPGNDTEEAWWRIPLYAAVTDVGIVSVEVDGRDGPVSSGVYQIARVPGGDYLYEGYRFTPENPQWITVREPSENAFAGTQTFRLVLENGSWFPQNDRRMGPQAILTASVVSGIEAGNVSEIRRVDDKTLELTIQRGGDSSVKSKGVWSIPLYFQVDEFGSVKVTLDSRGSAVTAEAFKSGKVTDPIRYIRTVTLTLNQPSIVMNQGTERSTVILDVSPVNPAGSAMIPVRGVFEQLGATVQWNAISRTVTIMSEDKQIVLNADTAMAKVNGSVVTLIQNPMIINGRLLIPLRSLSEQLGFGVEWLEETKQIIIRKD